LGIARPFLVAGVPAVLGNLWPVEDDEAAAFFDSFHGHLAAGGGSLSSLREAQLVALREGRSPAAWAGYQVLGGSPE
jgi:CHAT domain-containing protein